MKKLVGFLFICVFSSCSGGIYEHIVSLDETRVYSRCPVWPYVEHNRAYGKMRHPENCNFVY